MEKHMIYDPDFEELFYTNININPIVLFGGGTCPIQKIY